MNNLGLVVWGLKNGYQIFFHNTVVNPKDPEIQQTLEDARVLINYNSVDLRFYSLEWTERYKVFTGYLALYDWSNRENAYLAISLFVPLHLRVSGGPLDLVNKLLDTYRSKYIGDDYKIKRGTENPQAFFDLLEEAKVLPDAKRQRPNRPNNAGYGLVRFDSEEDLGIFFENTYLKEYEPFKEIFFLPAGQERLKASPVIKPIVDAAGVFLKPRSLAFPVSVKYILPAGSEADAADLKVIFNGDPVVAGADGVYAKDFPDADEYVLVAVSHDKYEPKSDGKTASEWSAAGVATFSLVKKPEPQPVPPPQVSQTQNTGYSTTGSGHGDDFKMAKSPSGGIQRDTGLPANSKFWTNKNNKPIDGPFTLQLFLKDKETKEAVDTHGKPVELNVINLGGVFYSNTSVLKVEKLHKKDHLEGTIRVEGYRIYQFKYRVNPEKNSVNSLLPPEEIWMDPLKQPGAATRARQQGGASISAGESKWNKKRIALGGVALLVLLALGAWGFSQIMGPKAGVSSEGKGALKTQVESVFNEKKDVLDKLIGSYGLAITELDTAIINAERAEIGEVELKNAKALVVEGRGQLDAVLYLEKLEAAKNSWLDSITSAVDSLPSLGGIADALQGAMLATKHPLEDSKNEVITESYRIQTLIERKGSQAAEAAAKADEVLKEKKRKAEELMAVADAAELKTTGTYENFLRWSKSTRITDFTPTRLRRQYQAKLALMVDIARAEYIARTEKGQAQKDALARLRSMVEDPKLTPAQKATISKKINKIMLG